MADALALGASSARSGGSSPLPPIRRKQIYLFSREDLKTLSIYDPPIGGECERCTDSVRIKSSPTHTNKTNLFTYLDKTISYCRITTA